MKKELSKLGLVGILSLGLLGTSAYGLETNEKGFPVPDKTEAEFVKGVEFEFDGGNIMRISQYVGSDGIFFNEALINNKAAEYIIFKKDSKEINHAIGDNDCNGIFESKYSAEEVLEKRPVPKCYLK
ncbi:hypothetical protein HYX19_00040 [Candidatus Woesearchaeota archaeon]|nr:hypothetical protein [Candidatus Woesearchaeota archaeon]